MILTNLDATALARPGRKDLESELGTVGSTISYFRDFDDEAAPSIAKLENMLNKDGTVKALYQILTLPILANKYRFVPDADDELVTGSGDAKETTHPQRDRVQDNFELPPHKGGLSIPLNSVIARMLRARLTGFQIFEKVWTKSPDNLIVYKKLAFRPADAVTILRDDNGGFAGFKQYVNKGGEFKEVTIPTDKAFLFTVNQDVDPVTGESDFRTAYYNFDKKHRLAYLYERQAETGAMPPKMLKVAGDNNDTKEVKESNLRAIEDFGLNTTVLVPQGYTIEPFDMGTGRLDPLPGIEYYNGEMARSVMAQQILMGTDGKTGSYSLAETHSDILIMSLESTMRSIEQFINFYLIPQLHEYNFDTPLYCEFKYDDMTDETRQVAIDIFTKIIDKLPSGLSLEFLQKLQEQMAERLGIDVENFEPNSLTPVASTPATPPATNNSKGSKKKELAKAWRRPLSDAEERVDLAAIENKMDTLESEFTESMRTTFNKVTDQALKDLKPILDSGDISELDSVKLKFPNEYKNVIKGSMNESYIFGKKGASAEVDAKIPATPKESKDYVNTTAQSIADKQLSDLSFLITSTVQSEFHKGQLAKRNLSADDIIGQLQEQFDDFFNGKIALTGGVIVSEAINRARDDVFSEYKDKVANYQYSAILDRKTCPLCEKADGAVLTEAEYHATKLVPPLHFLCRCIWVAILKTDPNVPEANGFADSIADLIDKYQTLHKHEHNVAVA